MKAVDLRIEAPSSLSGRCNFFVVLCNQNALGLVAHVTPKLHQPQLRRQMDMRKIREEVP